MSLSKKVALRKTVIKRKGMEKVKFIARVGAQFSFFFFFFPFLSRKSINLPN